MIVKIGFGLILLRKGESPLISEGSLVVHVEVFLWYEFNRQGSSLLFEPRRPGQKRSEKDKIHESWRYKRFVKLKVEHSSPYVSLASKECSQNFVTSGGGMGKGRLKRVD